MLRDPHNLSVWTHPRPPWSQTHYHCNQNPSLSRWQRRGESWNRRVIAFLSFIPWWHRSGTPSIIRCYKRWGLIHHRKRGWMWEGGRKVSKTGKYLVPPLEEGGSTQRREGNLPSDPRVFSPWSRQRCCTGRGLGITSLSCLLRKQGSSLTMPPPVPALAQTIPLPTPPPPIKGRR